MRQGRSRRVSSAMTRGRSSMWIPRTISRAQGPGEARRGLRGGSETGSMTLPALKPEYEALVAAWTELAERGVVDLRSLTAGDEPLLQAVIEHRGAPLVAISAGVHGDEPAGPSALLHLVREGLPREFAYVMWPCTNPSGYRMGTRRNSEGRDINRSYGVKTTAESRAVAASWPNRIPFLALDLHEDPETTAFYCYERSAAGRYVAPELVRRLEGSGIPIQRDLEGVDLGLSSGEATRLGLWQLERGWVRSLGQDPEAIIGGRPYSVWAAAQGVRRSFTFESPGLGAWETRLRSLVLAVRAALAIVPRDSLPSSSEENVSS
ncbi:hypothetical protein EPN52_07305 [bacterium]|nr:MAG: hypothetical protein EPN52_07305 [bacterium]